MVAVLSRARIRLSLAPLVDLTEECIAGSIERCLNTLRNILTSSSLRHENQMQHDAVPNKSCTQSYHKRYGVIHFNKKVSVPCGSIATNAAPSTFSLKQGRWHLASVARPTHKYTHDLITNSRGRVILKVTLRYHDGE